MKTNKFLIIAMIVLSFGSCKKSSDEAYKCDACVTTPEAVAANDASSKGIYKGVVIGSTGTIKFNLQNNGTDITAVMVIDGVTVNLTSSVAIVNGQPYIAPFTGTMNGSPVSITFSVDASGASPVITSSSIPGHPSAQFQLVKETSAALVEAYEGTYSSNRPETGTFNLLISRALGKWKGVHRTDGNTENIETGGTIDAAGKMYEAGTNYIGVLSGDVITGSFKDGDNNTITLNGKRKL